LHQSNRGRTDAAIARQLGMGGKDLYRQARAIWRLAGTGDVRAQSGIAQLDARTKTIHAAYKDLRRRDRFSADFRPTPYDVWSFRHDHAFGIPHPGAIPPAIVAHALHYYTLPGALVVDPMAGGGTTLDVCQSMGRCCLAYDIHPTRPDVRPHDVRLGFPPEAASCDLIFCDPPYHNMLARQYTRDGISSAPLSEWVLFLHNFARHAFETLRLGGYLALLLAAQTEKDLPRGFGYLDHAFWGYAATLRAGFLPERRISCPMNGAYLPQHIRQARRDGHLLGQVRDLLVMRKPSQAGEQNAETLLFMQGPRDGR
jgi:ParB family transcriptional regulator, chromosome partitioning protein